MPGRRADERGGRADEARRGDGGRGAERVGEQAARDHAEALPGPCKHIVWVQDAGHHIPYEQPEAFTDAMVQWIDEPPADCPPRPPYTRSDTR